MLDSLVSIPFPAPPKVEGIDTQKVLTLAEKIFTHGRIIKSKVPGEDIYRLSMMGTPLMYKTTQDEKLAHRLAVRLLVSSDDWEVTIINVPITKYDSQFSPTRVLRWGREGLRFIISYRFEGDSETFKRDMLYSQMVGNDDDVWEAMT